MKKYKCPRCLTTSSVIRYGYRKRIIRLFCKICKKGFSIDPYFIDKKSILYDHLDGLSFRSLANKYGMSHMRIWRICQEELKKLPNNNQFTFNYVVGFRISLSLMVNTSMSQSQNTTGCYFGELITSDTIYRYLQ